MNAQTALFSRLAVPSYVRRSLAALCLITMGLLWWHLASPPAPYKIFGLYSMWTFPLLLMTSYLLSWGLYFALSRESFSGKATNCALTTFTLLILIGLLEILPLLGLIDYRKVISPPESFLVTQVKPWESPGNLLDKELMHIHRPGLKMVGEKAGDLVDWLGISTERRYPLDLQYDGQGFRNEREIEQATVVALGDSFLEGVLVPQTNLVSSQLKRLLKVDVANLGQSGYGPQQELAVLQRFGIKLQPKIVLWFFFEGNDLLDVPKYERFIQDRENIIRKQDSFRKRSFFRNALFTLTGFTAPKPYDHGSEARRRSCQFLSNQSKKDETLYFDYSGVPLSKKDLASLDTAQNSFLQAQKLSADVGAKFLFVYVPTKFRVYCDSCEFPQDGYGKSWQPHDLPSRMEAWCKDNGISYLDLTPALKKSAASGDLVYFSDDGHWNAQGHQVVAEAVAQFLESGGWLTAKKGIEPRSSKTKDASENVDSIERGMNNRYVAAIVGLITLAAEL